MLKIGVFLLCSIESDGPKGMGQGNSGAGFQGNLTAIQRVYTARKRLLGDVNVWGETLVITGTVSASYTGSGTIRDVLLWGGLFGQGILSASLT